MLAELYLPAPRGCNQGLQNACCNWPSAFPDCRRWRGRPMAGRAPPSTTMKRAA
jgi:hypothetical protein